MGRERDTRAGDPAGLVIRHPSSAVAASPESKPRQHLIFVLATGTCRPARALKLCYWDDWPIQSIAVHLGGAVSPSPGNRPLLRSDERWTLQIRQITQTDASRLISSGFLVVWVKTGLRISEVASMDNGRTRRTLLSATYSPPERAQHWNGVRSEAPPEAIQMIKTREEMMHRLSPSIGSSWRREIQGTRGRRAPLPSWWTIRCRPAPATSASVSPFRMTTPATRFESPCSTTAAAWTSGPCGRLSLWRKFPLQRSYRPRPIRHGPAEQFSEPGKARRRLLLAAARPCPHSYLDVDEIAQGGAREVPEPAPAMLPDWAGKVESQSGTLVVWSKCDRLDHRRVSTIARKLLCPSGASFATTCGMG